MQRVLTFAEIEAEFMQRVSSMVYCSAATVDARQRPRSRVIHPIWEGTTGWFTSEPATAKIKQVAANPFISLAYIANPMLPVYIECRAVLQNDPDTRQRVWDLYKSIPEPFGSDLAGVWGHVESPAYAVLRLDPWRIELYDLLNQQNRKLWRTEG
jgi:general stress protein 26